MANKFYVAGEARAARVRELFDTIARRYDLINDLQSFGLHRRWKRRMLSALDLPPKPLVLDVCCGTGDVAGRLATRGARVVGVDFSRAMLQRGLRRGLGDYGAGRGGSVEFIQADALRLPLADAQFDAVTIAYGLRNLAGFERGLREMVRALKPGGRLAVLDFGKPQNALWRNVYFGYLQTCVPLMGRVFCGDREAYAYILESLRHFPSQTELARLLEKIGLRQVRAVHLLGGVMGLVWGDKPARAIAS